MTTKKPNPKPRGHNFQNTFKGRKRPKSPSAEPHQANDYEELPSDWQDVDEVMREVMNGQY